MFQARTAGTDCYLLTFDTKILTRGMKGPDHAKKSIWYDYGKFDVGSFRWWLVDFCLTFICPICHLFHTLNSLIPDWAVEIQIVHRHLWLQKNYMNLNSKNLCHNSLGCKSHFVENLPWQRRGIAKCDLWQIWNFITYRYIYSQMSTFSVILFNRKHHSTCN